MRVGVEALVLDLVAHEQLAAVFGRPSSLGLECRATVLHLLHHQHDHRPLQKRTTARRSYYRCRDYHPHRSEAAAAALSSGSYPCFVPLTTTPWYCCCCSLPTRCEQSWFPYYKFIVDPSRNSGFCRVAMRGAGANDSINYKVGIGNVNMDRSQP